MTQATGTVRLPRLRSLMTGRQCSATPLTKDHGGRGRPHPTRPRMAANRMGAHVISIRTLRLNRQRKPWRAGLAMATLGVALLVTDGAHAVPADTGSMATSGVSTSAVSWCPSGSKFDPTAITPYYYQKLYDSAFYDVLGRGVVRCDFDTGHVLIVNLGAGGKFRTVSEPVPGTIRGTADTQFNVRTTQEWYHYIAGGYVTSPRQGNLVAVINSGFIRNTGGGPTALSFPEKRADQIVSKGQDTDNADLRVLGLGIPGMVGSIGEWAKEAVHPVRPLNASGNLASALSPFQETAVGLAPYDTRTAENHTRNYVGLIKNAEGGVDYAYFLQDWHTNATRASAVQRLMLDFGVAQDQIIQLDGGGSTSYADRGAQRCFELYPFAGCRKVPEVIAIYAKPVP